ncbi:MAG: Endonuclease/Exonuclease/phosphatase family protein [Methanosaeta sp. PtaB.Bin039]|nr:MAG: Endonuclease/Exonuclease/phosphatase family protein [Methanosaeta sp. PtaB.Bin039]
MPVNLRIATFNLWNFDDRYKSRPSIEERIAVMRPQFVRLNADIVCLQEVNGQRQHQTCILRALNRLLEGTPYAGYHRIFTTDPSGQVYDERNLVILSRFEILEHHQYMNDYAPAPRYQKVTAEPKETEALAVSWERPILHARIKIGGQVVNVVNLHLKSRRPTGIPGQRLDERIWKTASGWAEGFFLSSLKQLGQALETRMLIDNLFDQDPNCLIAVCGDFNSEVEEVPVEAILGEVENTGNTELATRVMIPCERNIPEPARFSLLHNGRGKMLDHILVSRTMLAYFRGSEIHNELLHDQSLLFTRRVLYPESDHAPVIAEFELPDTQAKWPAAHQGNWDRRRRDPRRARYK